MAFPAKAGSHLSTVSGAEEWIPAFAGNAEFLLARPAQHRPEIAAADEVQMEMRHLLVRRRAVIGDDTIAALGYPLLPRDLPDGAHKGGQLGLARRLGEIVERHVFAFGDHDDMGRRPR